MVKERSWATWSLVLMWVHGLVIALAVVVLGLAGVLFAADNASHDDSWDGLGAAIAIVAGGVALAVLAGSLVLLEATRRTRRRAQVEGVFGGLRTTCLITAGLAGCWLVLVLSPAIQGGMRLDPILLILSAPPVLVLLVAAGTLTRLPRETSVTSVRPPR